jgi:hypothetical protein
LLASALIQGGGGKQPEQSVPGHSFSCNIRFRRLVL